MFFLVEIVLISIQCFPCRQQVVTSNTGPIFVFPWIQSFDSDESSYLGRVYSRQPTESVNCPTSTVVKNPASIQILITRFCCGKHSTSFLNFYQKISCAQISIEDVVSLSRILLARRMGQIVLPIRVSPFLFDKHCIPHAHVVMNFQLVLGIFAIDFLLVQDHHQMYVCLDHIWHEQWVGLSCHKKSPFLSWQDSHSSHISATVPKILS